MLQDKHYLMLVFVSANWDKNTVWRTSLFLFVDNAATAKLLKRGTRSFTSSVSDSDDDYITGVCLCLCLFKLQRWRQGIFLRNALLSNSTCWNASEYACAHTFQMTFEALRSTTALILNSECVLCQLWAHWHTPLGGACVCVAEFDGGEIEIRRRGQIEAEKGKGW